MILYIVNRRQRTMRVLVFDTETTGLPPKNIPINRTDSWPHVVQLSWAIYNEDTKQVEEEYDNLISSRITHSNICGINGDSRNYGRVVPCARGAD